MSLVDHLCTAWIHCLNSQVFPWYLVSWIPVGESWLGPDLSSVCIVCEASPALAPRVAMSPRLLSPPRPRHSVPDPPSLPFALLRQGLLSDFKSNNADSFSSAQSLSWATVAQQEVLASSKGLSHSSVQNPTCTALFTHKLAQAILSRADTLPFQVAPSSAWSLYLPPCLLAFTSGPVECLVKCRWGVDEAFQFFVTADASCLLQHVGKAAPASASLNTFFLPAQSSDWGMQHYYIMNTFQ